MLFEAESGKLKAKFFVLNYFCVDLHPKFSVLCAEDIVQELKTH